MNKRLSDDNEIFKIFRKMERKSLSILIYKMVKQNTFGDFLFMHALKDANKRNSLNTEIIVVRVIENIISAKFDVNRLKENICVWQFWIRKWQKHKNLKKNI